MAENFQFNKLIKWLVVEYGQGPKPKKTVLVDELGGLEEAISIAAGAAGLEEGDYKLRFYPRQKTFVEQILTELTGDYEESKLKSTLGEFYPAVKQIRNLQNYQGIANAFTLQYHHSVTRVFIFETILIILPQ